ncbi:WD40 repeat domain-containing protein [Streptomyces sp. NPDC001904]|uniref:WD40 repeat domain-containing protein n=1 Tax=Streptomyces sp. NPDC001904 TaxID=3154531 RepID=UPI00331B0659
MATLRSDFLTDFLATGYAALIHQPTLVGVLGRTELFEAIEKPAEQAGLSFAPGVVARMVDDTGGGDALPLLAYTLQELFLRVGSGGTVTEDEYRRLGAVAGALSDQADRITADLRTVDADTPVLSTLLKLVSLEHGEPTRRRVHREDLTPEERTVTDAFVTGRLLTSDNAVLDVAHEALFRQWAPLRQAVAAGTDKLRRRTELERWAQDWERSGRQDAYLLSGERLAVARAWADEASGALTGVPLVAAFLECSIRQDRISMQRVADAVAHRALESAERDPELAILASLAAIEECAPTSAAQQALHTALGASRRRAVFRGHERDVNAVAWSPDGSRLETASDDGTIRIWDAQGAVAPVVLTHAHGDRVYAVAWSPDGKRLAGSARDRTVTVWDAETWAALGVLTGHDDSVGALAWSPDGDRLATASSDRTVRIWDAETHAELTVLTGHELPVWALAWSLGRRQLASASDDGTVRVWSLAPGGRTTEMTGHRAGVSAVAWSPDGRRLASVSEDRTALMSISPPHAHRWARVRFCAAMSRACSTRSAAPAATVPIRRACTASIGRHGPGRDSMRARSHREARTASRRPVCRHRRGSARSARASTARRCRSAYAMSASRWLPYVARRADGMAMGARWTWRAMSSAHAVSAASTARIVSRAWDRDWAVAELERVASLGAEVGGLVRVVLLLLGVVEAGEVTLQAETMGTQLGRAACAFAEIVRVQGDRAEV